MTLYKLIVVVFLASLFSNNNAQSSSNQISIDTNGVMRWSADDSELHGFGINYTLPFAHEYRMAKQMGIPLEEAVKQDVYHMARLDLDLYRIHVWDTEISDTLGNLIINEHLRLFDYTVHEMKKRGILFIITPLAYWGNGWPQRDEPTPGFSYKYGKAACLTISEAIDAQANYLNQFLQHINQYTGIAYKDEPNVIAFEISNEPHHNGTAQEVTSFINKMVSSIRQTGCSKPLFYNMSHSINLVEAYLKANIQGGTFQWYPTNLVANQQINGNFLPHVDYYHIPFANNPQFKKMAKIVYEFDPADAGGNVMYPAMARSFREAGMQLAAQFAYDAMCHAPYNTNYGTHFMNLAYTPNKAISLKIASAVFHNVPLYQKQGNDNSRFDALNINDTDDLAQWVTDEKFFYSNNTNSKPNNSSQLLEIAGCGSSPLVKYNGTGAYFLDKLSDGIWRLEVMPNAYWIDDPYGKVDPNKQKAAVLHAQQQMTLSLPNLGYNFNITPINSGNNFQTNVLKGQFALRPGVYILRRNDITEKINPVLKYKNIIINEFVTPESNLEKTVLWNHSPYEVVEGKPFHLKFEAISPSTVSQVKVVMTIDDKWKTVTAFPQDLNIYHVEVPADMRTPGILKYHIIIENNDGITTFPSGKNENSWGWGNNNNEIYTVLIVPKRSRLTVWDAKTDWESTYKIWNPTVNLQPTCEGEISLAIRLDQLPPVDPIHKESRSYAFKFYFGEKIKGRDDELLQKKFLVVKASNTLTSPQPVEIGIIDKNGSVLAGNFNITTTESVYKIPLSSFTEASFIVIPRPFPDFLPYKVQSDKEPFDWSTIETVQFEVKPGKQTKVNLNIEKIWLE